MTIDDMYPHSLQIKLVNNTTSQTKPNNRTSPHLHIILYEELSKNKQKRS